jgi:uncharacterized membrane protein YuzA (DUF378 family)
MMHHKHHSPAMRLIGNIAWLLSAIAGLAWGLIGLGNSMGKNWNIWESDFIVNNAAWLVQPLQYAIGLAGLISLISWFMCLGKYDDHKHDKR